MAPMKASSTSTGSTLYKKKQGNLGISKDQKSITWTPRDAGSIVSLAMAHISNLQQTPETAAKVMLKIYEKSSDAAEPVAHTFTFDSPSNPRGEADAIKSALTPLIAAAKVKDPSLPKAHGSATSPAAMGTANSVISRSDSGTVRYHDDAQLKVDIELQQDLMKKDPTLQRTYMESRRTKSDTISDSQFNAQFWSTRINLLRAHAVERDQKRGQYNVLSVVKPRQADGELKLNISGEQISLIFNQHPLVKRVYDENVPKLNDPDFWSRFFQSRLFKKLKGERINPETDVTDPTFDRYLDASNDAGPSSRLLTSHVPHIIDLEGNEENQGGSKNISGNRQDWTMRPTDVSKIPIVRTLNSLSEKIMAHVAASDVNPADPIGMDEETFNSLALRDLRGDEQENRIMLNINDQSRSFSNDKSEVSTEAAVYANQVPHEVLSGLQVEVDPSMMNDGEAGRYDLRSAIGVLEDSDSEDDEATKVAHVGSKASLVDAQNQIFEGITARRVEIDGASVKSSLSGLSERIFDRLTLTHATTTEFLHHFWVIFLSGDPDRAGELAKMVETLERAMDRINAVAIDAEKERNDIISKEKQRIKDLWEQTGKKRKFDPNSVKGGEKVVKEMMEPTIKTLQKASEEYRKALAAEGIDAT